jgi:hypothetical protein
MYEQLPTMQSGEIGAWDGYPVKISTKVLLGSASVDDATCAVNIYDSVGAIVLTQDATYASGLYSLNWTPESIGLYIARWNCTGGALSSKVVYDVSSISVNSGVMMLTVS